MLRLGFHGSRAATQSQAYRQPACCGAAWGMSAKATARDAQRIVPRCHAGNLLVERMAGAEVHLVTKEEYTSTGSVALGERLAEQLQSDVQTLFLTA